MEREFANEEENTPNDKNKYAEDLMSAFLKKKAEQSNHSQPYEGESDSDEEQRISRLIKNVNNEFLINVLSPEIQKNEEKKRKHKDWLMIIMGGFLLFQFLLIAVIICAWGYFIINAHLEGNPFNDSTIKILFAFIGTYITSHIIELIAILRYIVKNVFDTSVTGMVNNFKD